VILYILSQSALTRAYYLIAENAISKAKGIPIEKD